MDYQEWLVGTPESGILHGGVNVQAEVWQADPNMPIAVAHSYFLIAD